MGSFQIEGGHVTKISALVTFLILLMMSVQLTDTTSARITYDDMTIKPMNLPIRKALTGTSRP